MNKPLAGLKVVELGTHVAVPKAARMMADWGAEVIKIEPPSGESWRTIGRVWNVPYATDNNPIFQSENANKKSLCVDLKSAEGQKAVLKLLETTDIFLTNTRPKPLVKLGLDYESVKAKFPKLIYTHFSGFGQDGPDCDRPGFDVAAYWARGGMLTEWSLKEYVPSKPQAGFGDSTVASAMLSGILAALYQREKTGLGDRIQLSLFSAALWFNSSGIVLGQPQYGFDYPKSRYDQVTPLSPLYKTKDGDWILISEPNWEGRQENILKMLGLESFVGDERFTTLEASRKNIKFIIDLLDDAFSKLTTKHVLDGFAALDVVHEKLANPNDVYKDEQAWANDYLRDVTLENGSKVVLPNNPIKFDSMPETDFALAPHLGADNANILASIGYSADEIKALVDSKVIVTKN